MKGIQATTVDTVAAASSSAAGAVKTDAVSFQNFLQGYTESALEQEVLLTEMPIEEMIETEEVEETIETDEGINQEEGVLVEKDAEEEVVAETVDLPPVGVIEESPMKQMQINNQHPQFFNFFSEEVTTEPGLANIEGINETASVPVLTSEEASIAVEIKGTETLVTQPGGNEGELNAFLPAEGLGKELSSANGTTEVQEAVTTSISEVETLQGKEQTTTTTNEQTVIEKVEVSPTALAQAVPTATVTIPVEMLPQEGTQKPQEVSAAVIEKISQPIVEKVTTMNAPDVQKITVELLPEKLGKMEVSIRVTDQKVQLEFIVENSQTRQLLESMTTKLERVLNKQEFPQVATQEKVTETTQVATELQSEANLFDQSAFQQGFQRENQQQSAFGKTAKSKTFAEIAMEKIEEVPGDGSVDLLV